MEPKLQCWATLENNEFGCQTVNYTIGNLSELFGVSNESIRKWCIEFKTFLSPTANPGIGKTRVFTNDDIQVLSLVAERRMSGVAMSDIYAELQNGGRGVLPDLEEIKFQALEKLEDSKQLQIENEILRDQIAEYRLRLEDLQQMREASIRAQVLFEMERERANKAEEKIQQLLEERRDLDREIARLKTLLENQEALNRYKK